MFKHSLGNDQDPGSFYLLKLFIEGILNISCKSITILNPDLVVENIEDKDMLLDIRVQTNTGDYVNIEMQYSAFSKNQYQRFQIYGASLLSRQEKEGDDYQKNINHVYQIIDASIYLGPVKQRNVNKMKTVLINTDNRCNLY